MMLRLSAAYGAFAVLKRLVPLDTLVRWAWREPPGAGRNRTREQRVTALVVRLSHLLRAAHGDCLHRSLLLYRELSAAGADPVLVVGFRRGDGGVTGHAWVVVDDCPVVEAADALAPFVPAVAFERAGLRRATPGDARG